MAEGCEGFSTPRDTKGMGVAARYSIRRRSDGDDGRRLGTNPPLRLLHRDVDDDDDDDAVEEEEEGWTETVCRAEPLLLLLLMLLLAVDVAVDVLAAAQQTLNM